MIEVAKENYPHLTFVHQDAHTLAEVDRYKLITAIFSIQWMDNPRKVFSNCYDALKPNGQFLLVVCPSESPYDHFQQRLLNKPRWSKYTKTYSIEHHPSTIEYLTLAQQIGFEVETIELKTDNFESDNLTICMQHFRACLPLVIDLPDELLDPFLEDATADFQQFEEPSTGIVNIPMKTLLLVLRR